MLADGVYKYYKLGEENDSRIHQASLKIENQNLFITEDPYGILRNMLNEGPVERRTEDVMKSVNRNHYAVFVKDEDKNKFEPSGPDVPKVKSVYSELGKAEEYEDLSKGDLANKIKTGAAGLVVAAGMAAPANLANAKVDTHQTPIMSQMKQQPANIAPNVSKEKEHILSSIMDVESSGNKDRAHTRLPQNTMHHGERAYGAYGITGVVARETIKANPDLKNKHSKAIGLMGSDFHNYMDKHPDLEHQIASKHYDRLAKIFGHDPEKIAMSWLNGVKGTKKAIKNGVDLKQHWHVKKVVDAYNKRKAKNIASFTKP